MEGHRSRLPLAILGAVTAAGVATLLLRPRNGLIDPASVSTTAYFSPDELERARRFRRPQRALALGGAAASGATLALLALRPPAAVGAAFERAERRPLAGSAATAAGMSLVLVAVGLPLSAAAHRRAVNVGLSTQDWGSWLGDVGKSTALEAAFAGMGGTVATALVRRFPDDWWAPAAGAALLFSVVAIYIFPVVIDPIFNKFEPLPEGELRSEVLGLADRAGVDVGEVYRVDASRRTTGINAYVNGLGRTKRVVLYDTLIRDFPEDQVRSVVAHELAHVKHRDLPRALLWFALAAPAASFLVQELAERIAGDRRPGPRTLPALALSAALVSMLVGSASNALSRRVEAVADAFALRATEDAPAFIELERKLAVTNVAEPEPPRLFQLLFGSHPTTRERIGIGEAWRRAR
jgi:STE24 endopeptidase